MHDAEIPVDDLIESATKARANSYSPYSGFAVGAAVLTRNGRIFTGCNVENASYGLTICAERNAVAAAVASGERDLLAVAVVTDCSPPASPCGACRQVLAEFGNVKVILANLLGERVITQIEELLPLGFDRYSLPSK
jgi:cytidine deaminase